MFANLYYYFGYICLLEILERKKKKRLNKPFGRADKVMSVDYMKKCHHTADETCEIKLLIYNLHIISLHLYLYIGPVSCQQTHSDYSHTNKKIEHSLGVHEI